MNYFYAIVSEALLSPAKILDCVEKNEGAVFWSEEDRKTTIENYRDTIAGMAFLEKDSLKELMTGENRSYDMGRKTAYSRIMCLRNEYEMDEQSIQEIDKSNPTMDLLKLTKWADKSSRKTAKRVLSANMSKDLDPER